MLVLQLAVPRAVTLPEPGVVRPFAIASRQPAPIATDPVILARSIFGGGSGLGAAVTGPVDGATAIGVLARPGTRVAFVRGADGEVVSLRPGDLYHGWRLRAIERGALLFDRDGQSASLPVTVQGSATPSPAPPSVPGAIVGPAAATPPGALISQPHG
jgi:hypothetical protein